MKNQRISKLSQKLRAFMLENNKVFITRTDEKFVKNFYKSEQRPFTPGAQNTMRSVFGSLDNNPHFMKLTVPNNTTGRKNIGFMPIDFIRDLRVST